MGCCCAKNDVLGFKDVPAGDENALNALLDAGAAIDEKDNDGVNILVFDENDPGDRLYIIERGEVEFFKKQGEDDELLLNEQLGAAMKAIAMAKRRRDQHAGELRPSRGVKSSWRTPLRVYVTPSARRGYVDSWLVVRDV